MPLLSRTRKSLRETVAPPLFAVRDDGSKAGIARGVQIELTKDHVKVRLTRDQLSKQTQVFMKRGGVCVLWPERWAKLVDGVIQYCCDQVALRPEMMVQCRMVDAGFGCHLPKPQSFKAPLGNNTVRSPNQSIAPINDLTLLFHDELSTNHLVEYISTGIKIQVPTSLLAFVECHVKSRRQQVTVGDEPMR
jgi:hypothetical protein